MIAREQEPASAKAASDRGSTPVTSVEIKHILFVDDNVELLQLYKEMLEATGFVVTVSTDGVFALTEIMKIDVDAIICDLMMENLDGPMFYMAVERIKPNLCPRFIFITGKKNEPSVGAFLRKTQGRLLYKPVTLEQLVQELEGVFERNRVLVESSGPRADDTEPMGVDKRLRRGR